MFQFPEFAPTIIGNKSSTYWVTPFGYPWIYSYLPIPMAFRNLLRPSSPLKALGIPLCTLIYLLLYSCSRFCMSTRMSMIFAYLRVATNFSSLTTLPVKCGKLKFLLSLPLCLFQKSFLGLKFEFAKLLQISETAIFFRKNF